MTEITRVINYTSYTIITFSCINSLYLNQFYHNTIFKRPIDRIKKTNQTLPFVCSQFRQPRCLNILADNICFYKQVKNQ